MRPVLDPPGQPKSSVRLGQPQRVLGHEVEDHLAADRRDPEEPGHAPQVGQAVLAWTCRCPRGSGWPGPGRPRAASAAEYLAMLAASPASGVSPAKSHSQAALSVISRASSTSILALANGWEMPWCRPMGVPHTSRVLGVLGRLVPARSGRCRWRWRPTGCVRG